MNRKFTNMSTTTKNFPRFVPKDKSLFFPTLQKRVNQYFKDNIEKFVESLVSRGIDYRLGLVLFSDVVERSYQPTENVKEFLGWLQNVEVEGEYRRSARPDRPVRRRCAALFHGGDGKPGPRHQDG